MNKPKNEILEAAFATLTGEQKEDIGRAQKIEYNKILAEALKNNPRQIAENLAEDAVEKLTIELVELFVSADIEKQTLGAEHLKETSSIQSEPPAQQTTPHTSETNVAPPVQKKYTFEFEITKDGAFGRNIEISANGFNRIAAFDIALNNLPEKIRAKGNYRYTGIYRKEPLEGTKS